MRFFERLAKMCRIDEAALHCNFLERKIGCLQQISRSFQACPPQETSRRYPMMTPKQTRKMRGAKGVIRRHLRNTQRILQICSKVMGRRLNPIHLTRIQSSLRRANLDRRRLLCAARHQQQKTLHREPHSHLRGKTGLVILSRDDLDITRDLRKILSGSHHFLDPFRRLACEFKTDPRQLSFVRSPRFFAMERFWFQENGLSRFQGQTPTASHMPITSPGKNDAQFVEGMIMP